MNLGGDFVCVLADTNRTTCTARRQATSVRSCSDEIVLLHTLASEWFLTM